MKCSKRVMYVSSIGRDWCFATSRSDLEIPVPRFSILSRQALFMAASPGIHYE
jgi:hypothetical protein